MTFKTLELLQNDSGVLTIGLNRPDVRNAFNEVLIQELTQVFSKQALDPKVRLIVLKGKGPVFCAGGDLNWMKKAVDFSEDQNLADTRLLTNMFRLMNECPKPLIGAVHGAAIGGGVGLVSVCDIVVASSDAVFSLSEVRLGLVPACIGPFVISKIGATHARALFVSAERFNAQKALSVGLVHEIVADSALDDTIEKITKNMLQCSPNALNEAKKLILDLSWPERRAEVGDPFDYASCTLARLRVSKEGQEGVRAFLEKRNPSWIK